MIYSCNMTELALTTDYVRSTGDPEPFLRKIAAAGFTAVHWCHKWLGEYRYRDGEVHRIAGLLRQYELKLIDLHAAVGLFSDWSSKNELRRKAGLGQIKNRIHMTAELGGDAVVLHVPEGRIDAQGVWMTPVRRSLNELEREVRNTGVRIALENLPAKGHMESLLKLCGEYSPEFLGICYDSGHGNLAGNGLELLEQMVKRDAKEGPGRIAALHLHDNEGDRDSHLPPFRGTVDWHRLIRILKTGGYKKPLCQESSIRHTGEKSEGAFLNKCFKAGERLDSIWKNSGTYEFRMGENGE